MKVNPPYHAPMVELVPSEWTNEFTKTETRKIMSEVGQVPVSMSKEIPGFILNRLQYALLNECWRLVADDIVSAEDLDVVMKDGLGLRYTTVYKLLVYMMYIIYILCTYFSKIHSILKLLGMLCVDQWK